MIHWRRMFTKAQVTIFLNVPPGKTGAPRFGKFLLFSMSKLERYSLLRELSSIQYVRHLHTPEGRCDISEKLIWSKGKTWFFIEFKFKRSLYFKT